MSGGRECEWWEGHQECKWWGSIGSVSGGGASGV